MRFQEYRKATRQTLIDIEEATGISRSALSRIDRGEAVCKIDTALAIVLFSQDNPTPTGEVVTIKDLIPSETAA